MDENMEENLNPIDRAFEAEKEKMVKSGDEYTYKAESLDDIQTYLLLCERMPDDVIRLEYNGKYYSKEQITSEFMNAEAKKISDKLKAEMQNEENPLEEEKTPERTSLEDKLINAMGDKKALSKILQDLDREMGELEARQANGKSGLEDNRDGNDTQEKNSGEELE